MVAQKPTSKTKLLDREDIVDDLVDLRLLPRFLTFLVLRKLVFHFYSCVLLGSVRYSAVSYKLELGFVCFFNEVRFVIVNVKYIMDFNRIFVYQ